MQNIDTVASIRAEAERLGTVPYLLTCGEDGRPHAVATTITWRDGALSVKAGRRSLANVAARPLISVMWPAPDAASYGLFVDGAGSVDGDWVALTPSRAVLHRSGEPATPSASGCGSDCRPLLG